MEMTIAYKHTELWHTHTDTHTHTHTHTHRHAVWEQVKAVAHKRGRLTSESCRVLYITGRDY